MHDLESNKKNAIAFYRTAYLDNTYQGTTS